MKTLLIANVRILKKRLRIKINGIEILNKQIYFRFELEQLMKN